MNKEDLLLTPGELFTVYYQYDKELTQSPIGFLIKMKRVLEAQLDKVLKPEWKGQPDSKGDWWLHNNKVHLTILHFKTTEDALNYSGEKGKWTKVIVPELMEEMK